MHYNKLCRNHYLYDILVIIIIIIIVIISFSRKVVFRLRLKVNLNTEDTIKKEQENINSSILYDANK